MDNKQNKIIPSFSHPQQQSSLPSYGQVDGYTPDLNDLARQVNELSVRIDNKIHQHIHDGGDAKRINLNTDILGIFDTVSVIPTATPSSFYEQIKIYTNGTTYRFYWFDVKNNIWHYVTATA